jgi:membrane protein
MRSVLDILALSIERFSNARAAGVAASLAYYALFSIFPFFLALIASASFILKEETIFSQVTELIVNFLPVSKSLIEENLQTIIELRGPVRIIGFVGLVWAGTGVFSSLIYNINMAWPDTKPRNFFRNRLASITIIFSVIAMVSLYIFFTTVSNLLTLFDPTKIIPQSADSLPFQSFISHFFSWVVKVLIFFLLYMWAPNTRVPWRAALAGAIVSGLGWDLATEGFSWYLKSGIPTYELIYGSLGAIVGLMLWFYIISLVILYGAHLGGAITAYSSGSGRDIQDPFFE